MNEILNELLKALTVALIPVVATLAGLLAKKALAWLESKTTNEYLKTVEHEAEEIVLALDAEIVSTAKQAASDGVITQAELAEAFARAKNKALELLQIRLKNYPAKIAAQVASKASEVIEAQITKQKANGSIQNPQSAQALAPSSLMPVAVSR